jgi:hypothetical protein
MAQPKSAIGKVMVGSNAVGALAVGAAAFGAMAIGALAESLHETDRASRLRMTIQLLDRHHTAADSLLGAGTSGRYSLWPSFPCR